MPDRLVNELEIISQPLSHIKFLKCCQYNEISRSLKKQFHEINLECRLRNSEFMKMDMPNINLYVSVSIVLDNLRNDTHPFVLKCSDTKIRQVSRLLQSNKKNSTYLFELNKETMTCSIKDLYVTCLTPEELEEYYESVTIDQMKSNLARSTSTSSDLVRSLSNPAETSSKANTDSGENLSENLNKLNIEVNRAMASNFNLNKLKVKLQVIIHELTTNKLENYLTEAVYSNVIENGMPKSLLNDEKNEDQIRWDNESKLKLKETSRKIDSVSSNNNDSYSLTNTSLNNLNNLRILRYSRLTGSVNGGDELFLFCSYFDSNDIEVEFIQFKQDTEISWRALASLDKTDIHGNCALIVKTPKYVSVKENSGDSGSKNDLSTKFTNLKANNLNDATQNNRVKVYYRLFRPSTKEYSEKCAFYYFNDAFNDSKMLFSENLIKESPLLDRIFKIYRPIVKQYASIESQNQNEDLSLVKETLLKHLPENHHLKKKVELNFKYFEIVKKLLELDITSNSDIKQKKTSKSNEMIIGENDDDVLDQDDLMDNYETILDWSHTLLNMHTDFKVDKEEKEEENNDTNIDHVPSKKVKKSSTNNSNKKKKTLVSESNQLINLKNEIASPSLQKAKFSNAEVQTSVLIPKDSVIPVFTTLESIFPVDQKTKNMSQIEIQLRSNLDSCIAKMNALADRTGKALIKFSKTRSFHELLKTQRFLINVPDEDGNTPIHLCILYGNFDLLEIFVDVALTIPDQNLINLKNHKNLTPLLVAVYLEETEVCELLLEANADLAQTDIYGCNAIHVACKKKNVHLLKTLIKYVDKNCNYSVVNSVNHDGYTPLHLAVLSQSLEMVQELLYLKYLKINIQDKRAGLTALHHAAGKFNLYLISNLLVKNENVQLDVRAYNGCTPLHMSIANRNYLITCLLLSHGANLNIQSDIPVHCDSEMFAMALKKDALLRRCIEDVLSRIKENGKDSKVELNEAKQISDEVDSKTGLEMKTNNFIDISDVKLSQEIKKIYDNEIEKDKTDDLNDLKSKLALSQHNYDSYYYSQNDSWMLEIFKSNKKIRRELFEKILCFEKYRKIYNDVQPSFSIKKINAENIEKIGKLTKNKYFDKNKRAGQIKISQQATCSNEDEKMEINFTYD